MSKKISIIIPVYNVENYIKKCLDSVVTQNCSNFEVVIVIDGSKDASADICHEYAEKYDYITVFEQENKGLSAARNKGIELATGDYILLLDSDDWLTENGLSHVQNVIDNTAAEIIFGKIHRYFEDTNRYRYSVVDFTQYADDISPYELYCKLSEIKNFGFCAPHIVASKKFIVDNGLWFYEGIYHEDELWVPLVMTTANTVATCNEGHYVYRYGRTNSICTAKNIKKEYDKLAVIDELKKALERLPKEKHRYIKYKMRKLEWWVIRNGAMYKNDDNANSLIKEIAKRKYALAYVDLKYIIPYIMICISSKLFLGLLWKIPVRTVK